MAMVLSEKYQGLPRGRWYECHFDCPGHWRVVELLRQLRNARASGDRVVGSRGLLAPGSL